MTFPIRITDKRKLKNGLVRCKCNGMELTGPEEFVKNSCRLIKLTGLKAPAYLNFATHDPKITNEAIKLDLPEWDSTILETTENLVEKAIKDMERLHPPGKTPKVGEK